MLSKKFVMSIMLSTVICCFVSTKAYANSNVERVYGNDRYGTSVSIANYFKGNELNGIIITNGENFADALSGNNLEIMGSMPVMLVGDSVKDSSKTINYIQNNLKKDGKIYILGGQSSVNSEFENYFKNKGYSNVVRLGGKDRYDTNISILNQVNIKEGTPITVVNGEEFPDAISVSSEAASKGYPVFMVSKTGFTEKQQKKINEIKPSKVYVIGGEGAVNSSIVNKLNNVVRIAGKDRYETSINVGKYFNTGYNKIIVASGENFADALSSAALASKLKAQLIVTNDNNIDSLKKYISGNNFKNVILIGGNKVMSNNIYKSLQDSTLFDSSQHLTEKAEGFISDLKNNNTEDALSRLSCDLKSEQGEDILKKYMPAFTATINSNGVDLNSPIIKQSDEPLGKSVTLTCKTSSKDVSIDANVKFDNDGSIYDFSFSNNLGEGNYKLPSYVDKNTFTEKEVLVGDGKYKLKGMLSIPKGKGPFSAVVLVQGSGASDMDESVEGHKIFKDIAEGLASKKIAVLRFDKRPYEYGMLTFVDKKFDLNKESINDAVSGVNLLKKTSEIDQNKIFVLGHSLGAMLTPTILKDCGENGAAGGIMMGTPVDFLDTFLTQSKYLKSINMMNDAQLASVKKLYDMVGDKSFPQNLPDDQIMYGSYSHYWESVKTSTHIKDAENLEQPLLLLQGQRDYQVEYSNLDKWKSYLSDKKNVEYNLYNNLNHLFISGEGKMTPEEYLKPGNVPDYVVNDISKWILKQ